MSIAHYEIWSFSCKGSGEVEMISFSTFSCQTCVPGFQQYGATISIYVPTFLEMRTVLAVDFSGLCNCLVNGSSTKCSYWLWHKNWKL